MQESLINKEARERFAASPMNRAFPEIIETMDQVAEMMESTKSAVGSINMEFVPTEEIKRGEYVPIIVIAVVKADEFINGNQLVVGTTMDLSDG